MTTAIFDGKAFPDSYCFGWRMSGMSLYLLRFKVETCLTKKEDLAVEFGGSHPVFLFSQKTADDKHVIAQVEMEAPNNRDAWTEVASSLLPPIIDSLSFATGTPLLLRDCELILKNESGSATRRAIYVGHRHVPESVPFGAVETDEMNKILADGTGVRLPLCWHRYALDRQLAHEQFVFNWLAFEALAGDADVTTRCPKCREEVEHCGSPVSHRSSSKVSAREIFQAAHPNTTDQEFNNRIWSKARNYVFHGRRYPEPEYLVELNTISQMLHTAIDKRLEEVLGLHNRQRPHHRYETWYRHFLFVEWATNDPAERFASDWPSTHLAQMSAENAPGAAHQAAMAAGVDILNYEQQSPTW